MASMFVLNLREGQSYGFLRIPQSCVICSVERSHFLCGSVLLVKCFVKSVVQEWRRMLKVCFTFYSKSITLIVWLYMLNTYARKIL